MRAARETRRAARRKALSYHDQRQGGHRRHETWCREADRVVAAALAASGGPPAPPRRSSTRREPVEIVVPFVPGGGTDLIARATADYMGKKWGQPLLVVNKPGGGGVIGARAALKDARPDGYTVLMDIHTTALDDDRRVEDAAAHARRPQVGGADRARPDGLRRQGGRAVEGASRSCRTGSRPTPTSSSGAVSAPRARRATPPSTGSPRSAWTRARPRWSSPRAPPTP